jgi:mono/diheme cytochrome c family protein
MMGRVTLSCFVLLSIAGPLSGCSENRASGLSDAARHGQYLFELHCADCHESAHPELRKQPPKLEGLFRANTLPSGAPATDAQVRKTVIEGKGTMPAFDQRLREQDIDDLVKYVHTLK